MGGEEEREGVSRVQIRRDLLLGHLLILATEGTNGALPRHTLPALASSLVGQGLLPRWAAQTMTQRPQLFQRAFQRVFAAEQKLPSPPDQVACRPLIPCSLPLCQIASARRHFSFVGVAAAVIAFVCFPDCLFVCLPHLQFDYLSCSARGIASLPCRWVLRAKLWCTSPVLSWLLAGGPTLTGLEDFYMPIAHGSRPKCITAHVGCVHAQVRPRDPFSVLVNFLLFCWLPPPGEQCACEACRRNLHASQRQD